MENTFHSTEHEFASNVVFIVLSSSSMVII